VIVSVKRSGSTAGTVSMAGTGFYGGHWEGEQPQLARMTALVTNGGLPAGVAGFANNVVDRSFVVILRMNTTVNPARSGDPPR
jgi:hypothetical protein